MAELFPIESSATVGTVAPTKQRVKLVEGIRIGYRKGFRTPNAQARLDAAECDKARDQDHNQVLQNRFHGPARVEFGTVTPMGPSRCDSQCPSSKPAKIVACAQ